MPSSLFENRFAKKRLFIDYTFPVSGNRVSKEVFTLIKAIGGSHK